MKNSEIVTYPVIEKIEQGTTRPLLSIMIPVYNRLDFLKSAINSVLSQDFGADLMQIEVIDNCSNVDVSEYVVNNFGGRVKVYRQQSNVGMAENWNTCIRRAVGKYVHILHDDDMVLDGFYAKLLDGLESSRQVGAAFCRCIFIDEQGHHTRIASPELDNPGVLNEWHVKIGSRQLIQCPSIVVKREVYENIGGFLPDLAYSVDWEMWRRISIAFSTWYEPAPLACYRVHKSSTTAIFYRLGKDIADTRRSIRLCENYYPETQTKSITAKALYNYSVYAFNNAEVAFLRGDYRMACAQIVEGFRCCKSFKSTKKFIKIACRALGVKLFSNKQASINGDVRG